MTTQLMAQGYVCAVGGGSEDYGKWSDEPYRWMVEKSGKGPALVMHYNDGSSWYENYFKSFGASSAKSLVISSISEANDSSNYRQVLEAKLIFLRGGNQYRYYQYWKNTLIEKAMMQVFQNGGVIGGSSAGLAVLGGIDYIAPRGSANPSDCLKNPFDSDITLADDFLPLVPNVLFDSHFTTRARLGRMLAFLGNWQTTKQQDILAIGVDENTAFCVEPDGKAFASGAGSVTIVHQNENSLLKCQAGHPLSFANWTIHLLTRGFRYDLVSRQLISAPETARAIPPVQRTPIEPSAKLFLQSSDLPGSSQEILKQLIGDGSTAVLLLSGQNDNGFENYLKITLGAGNVERLIIGPDILNSDAATAKVLTAQQLIVTSMSQQEISVFLTPNKLLDAWRAKIRDSQSRILMVGNSVPLVGDLYITNLSSNSSNLLNGKLIFSNSGGFLSPSFFGYDAFSDDSYDENRVGGFFALGAKLPGSWGALLSFNSGIEIEKARVRATCYMPALLLDAAQLSYTDSSAYRTQPLFKPRQSFALINGRLHCLNLKDGLEFDLNTREISQTTEISPESKWGSSRPSHYELQIYPNPGRNLIEFLLPQTTGMAPPRELYIFNVRGQRVAQISPVMKRNGLLFRWQIAANTPSGQYFAVLTSAIASSCQPFTVLK